MVPHRFEKEKSAFLGSSFSLSASKVFPLSFSASVSSEHARAGAARWTAAALFAPVGSAAVGLVVLPGETPRATG